MPMSETKRILVLGGGFAGVYAAMALEKRLGRRQNGAIPLVSRDNFILFTPTLYQGKVAASAASAASPPAMIAK